MFPLQRIVAALVISCFAVTVSPAAAPAADVYAQVEPSIVLIDLGSKFGTGFFVGSTPDHVFVLTALHVVGSNKTLKVYAHRAGFRTSFLAAVYKTDKDHDLALLSGPAGPYPALPIAAQARVGESIASGGYDALAYQYFKSSGDLQPNFHSGSVSSIRLGGSVIVHDVPTDSGNSGGPIFDGDSGSVIGVVIGAYVDHANYYSAAGGSAVLAFLHTAGIAVNAAPSAQPVAAQPVGTPAIAAQSAATRPSPLASSGDYFHSPQGTAAFLEAVATQNQEFITRALAAGADVNATNATGQTALMLAFAPGRAISAVPTIVEVVGVDPNRADDRGDTALDFAIATNQPRWVFEELLAFGADPNHADKLGAATVSRAAGRADVRDLFTKFAAYHRSRPAPTPRDYAFLRAIAGANDSFVHSELLAGISPDTRDALGGSSVSRAIIRRRLAVLGELLQRGADPNFPDMFGRPPLFFASRGKWGNAQAAVVLVLLKAGASRDWKVGGSGAAAWFANTGPAHVIVAGGSDVKPDIVRLLATQGPLDHDTVDKLLAAVIGTLKSR